MKNSPLALNRGLAALGISLTLNLMNSSTVYSQDSFGSGPGPLENTDQYAYPAKPDIIYFKPSTPILEGTTYGTIGPWHGPPPILHGYTTPHRPAKGLHNGPPVEERPLDDAPSLTGRCDPIPEEEMEEFNNITTINGENIAIQDDNFRRDTRLPDARTLLGQSLCDLSYRPIACEEVNTPKDFPPLPKQITLPREISEGQIRHDPPPSRPFEFSFPLNLSGKGPLFPTANIHNRQMPLEVLVPAADVKAMSDASYEAACNPDYESMFAAYCMQLQHTGTVPAYLYEQINALRTMDQANPNAYLSMAKLKHTIAQVKPCTASPAQRAKLADSLERAGRPYEALVHRLRCVDSLDDGPSRLALAKLYFKLNEKKLGFETLREAAQKTWSKSQSQVLSEVHFLTGKYIQELAKDAEKTGNEELRMLRLRNASACFRRALCLDRNNGNAANRLIAVAREAASFDNSFDNQLMLGGACLLAGDCQRAESAYNECATIAPRDARLKAAHQVLEIALGKKPPLSADARLTERAEEKPVPLKSKTGLIAEPAPDGNEAHF